MHKSQLTEDMLHNYTNKKGEPEIFLMLSLDLRIRVDYGPQINRQGMTKLVISGISNSIPHPSKKQAFAFFFFLTAY